MSGIAALPALYAGWIERALDRPIMAESHATCGHCAMCKPPGHAATASTVSFRPDMKCCSFVPTLPNFLVGSILADESPETITGRTSIRHRIEAGDGVSPLGLGMPRQYALIYQRFGDKLFGRNKALLCPHFVDSDGGLCGIWRHRNAVCATYFCKFDHGVLARTIWDRLRTLLTTIERRLAFWCAIELGEDVDSLGVALLAYGGTSPPGVPDTDFRRSARQDDKWLNREVGFYKDAAKLVAQLDWNQVLEIGGLEASGNLISLRAAQSALATYEIPARLRLGPIGVARLDEGSTAVCGYSDRDMPILPTRLVDALLRFDGQRSTAEVVGDIAVSTGRHLDDETLRELIEFGILCAMPVLPPVTEWGDGR